MGRQFAEVLLSGIASGSVYALMAIGMALVYGVTKVFNFAYGSFFTLGGYLAWSLFRLKIGYGLVLLGVIPLLYLAGLVSEKLLIRPLRKRRDWEMAAVMVTLGLALFLDNLHQLIFGPYTQSIPPLFKKDFVLRGIVISLQDLSIFTISIAAVVAFMLFLNNTRPGMAMRAVAQDMVGAQVVGIPRDRAFGHTFAISAVLVGLGGILLAPKYFVSPFGGWTILVKAWVITAFGGMGSIKGSLYAAFILGIIEAFVSWQLGMTWILVVWFLVLIVTLIARPQGLLGTWG